MTILPLLFQSGSLSFIFLVLVLWLGLPTVCLMEVVRVSILVLFEILAGRLSAFHC